MINKIVIGVPAASIAWSLMRSCFSGKQTREKRVNKIDDVYDHASRTSAYDSTVSLPHCLIVSPWYGTRQRWYRFSPRTLPQSTSHPRREPHRQGSKPTARSVTTRKSDGGSMMDKFEVERRVLVITLGVRRDVIAHYPIRHTRATGMIKEGNCRLGEPCPRDSKPGTRAS